MLLISHKYQIFDQKLTFLRYLSRALPYYFLKLLEKMSVYDKILKQYQQMFKCNEFEQRELSELMEMTR